MREIEDRLAALATMSPGQLRSEWRQVWKTAAPDMTPDLLARGVAWKIQQRAFGGMSTDSQRKLRTLMAGIGPIPAAAMVDAKPKLGTRLIREWNGRTVSVLVVDDGYVFEERTYRSLSEIARLVTGTHWSGPRFFGLRAAKPIREMSDAT